MKRNLTTHLLAALKSELQIMSWNPEIHTARRPITVDVSTQPADANLELRLELGRYNNVPDSSYHQGVVSVAFWGVQPRTVEIEEGTTALGELLKQGDTLLIIKSSFSYLLTGDDPGGADYTIFLRTGVTLQQARDQARSIAREMVAVLPH